MPEIPEVHKKTHPTFKKTKTPSKGKDGIEKYVKYTKQYI